MERRKKVCSLKDLEIGDRFIFLEKGRHWERFRYHKNYEWTLVKIHYAFGTRGLTLIGITAVNKKYGMIHLGINVDFLKHSRFQVIKIKNEN